MEPRPELQEALVVLQVDMEVLQEVIIHTKLHQLLTRQFIRDSGKSIWFLHVINMALFFVSIYYQIILYYHKIWQNIIQATGQTQVTLHANQTHVLPNDQGVYTSTIFQVKSLFVCLFVCLWCVVVIILNKYPKFIDMSGQIIVWDHSEPGGTEKAFFLI